MTMASIPDALEEITPSWLTGALAPQLASESVTVTNVESDPIALGVGFAGGLGRLSVEYDRDSESAPKTLIAKLPSAHAPTRNLLTALGVYEREVRFYQSVASEIPMRTPKCFVASFDSESKGFILLLEDLGAMRSPDQTVGCAVDDAKLAVETLAKLHGSIWNSPLLGEWNWAPKWDTGAEVFASSFPGWWARLQQNFPSAISAEFRKTAEMVTPHVASIKSRLSRRPVTLCHGDYRLANMFFDDTDKASPLVVFDWQAVRVGRAPYDLAYFLGGSMTVEDRRAHERQLKATYYASLIQAGVTNYSEHEFEEDYGYALLDLVSFTALVGGNLSFDNEQAQNLMIGLISRVADTLSYIDAERLIANLP